MFISGGAYGATITNAGLPNLVTVAAGQQLELEHISLSAESFGTAVTRIGFMTGNGVPIAAAITQVGQLLVVQFTRPFLIGPSDSLGLVSNGTTGSVIDYAWSGNFIS